MADTAQRSPGRPTSPPIQLNLPPWLRRWWWVVVLPVAAFGYWWFVQRVEVGTNQLLVLVRKVGRELPSDPQFGDQNVLHPALLKRLGEPPDSARFKGIVYEPKLEGRYFYDPFLWERIIVPATLIKQDEVGIVVRRFGRPLAAGKAVATEADERGPLEAVLKSGRHNVNPFAYEVFRVKPVVIPPGQVGVQTLLAGATPKNPNDYVVAEGERGVQPTVLREGTYYNNPYVRRIDLIETRSHTIDLHNESAIRFPSNDSFEILVDCTVEYAIRHEMAPYVMVAVGEHEDIREKLILPFAKSLCRIEGSKLIARDFIAGDTRVVFQNRIFTGLREQCYGQGIEVRAVLIRRIVPPAEIAEPISDRQLAGQQIKQYENEIKLAEAEALLVSEQEMQKQNQVIGQANREVVSVIKQAEQSMEVALIAARQRLEVAKLDLEAAAETAAAVLSRGQAEAEIKLLGFEAQAKPLRDAVASFGDGESYAQFYFYQKLAPAMKSVLASTDGPLAEIFRALSESGGGAAPGREPSRPSPRPKADGAPHAAPTAGEDSSTQTSVGPAADARSTGGR